jgi:hypothetical protein
MCKFQKVLDQLLVFKRDQTDVRVRVRVMSVDGHHILLHWLQLCLAVWRT